MAEDAADTPPRTDGDTVTSVSSATWLQRIAGSFVAALIGLVLIAVSIVLLSWNEGRAVTAARALEQGERDVIEVAADRIDLAANGKLVHLVGPMTTTAPAKDRQFGVSGDGLLRVKRHVEMLQWEEKKSSSTQKQTGGSATTETTATYAKVWSDAPKDSARFVDRAGHENPPMPVKTMIYDTGTARLGAFRVASDLLDAVDAFAPLSVDASVSLPAGYQRVGDMLYRGRDSTSPEIGDVRVTFSAVPSQTLSVIGGQAGDTLASFRGEGGYRIRLAVPGVASAAAMFEEKQQSEATLTWMLRGVGLVLMVIAFALCMSPISALAAFIPLLEEIVAAGSFVVALLLGVVATLLTVAAAWLTYRPMIAVAFILVALAAPIFMHRFRRIAALGALFALALGTAHAQTGDTPISADCPKYITIDRLKAATSTEWVQSRRTGAPPANQTLDCHYSGRPTLRAVLPNAPTMMWFQLQSYVDAERGMWRTYKRNYEGTREPAAEFGEDAFWIKQRTGAWILVTRAGNATNAAAALLPDWPDEKTKAFVAEIARSLRG